MRCSYTILSGKREANLTVHCPDFASFSLPRSLCKCFCSFCFLKWPWHLSLLHHTRCIPWCSHQAETLHQSIPQGPWFCKVEPSTLTQECNSISILGSHEGHCRWWGQAVPWAEWSNPGVQQAHPGVPHEAKPWEWGSSGVSLWGGVWIDEPDKYGCSVRGRSLSLKAQHF